MVEKVSYSFVRSHDDIEAFQMGQWGDQRGKEWSYKPNGMITGIMVSCNEINNINSLVFKGVDENGNVEYSDTIGCHYKNAFKVGSFNQEECIKVGPWGWPRSSTDEEWSYMLKGGATTVIKIGFNGDYIKWISFKNSDEKSEVKHSVQNSNATSDESHEAITLNWPEEYLVSITGTLRAPMKDIESLCFYTNQTIYGPFGFMKLTGIPFKFYMKGGIIVGFHGRVGNYFDALGAYIMPFSEFENDAGFKVGPFGGQGGKEWIYKPNDAVTEITISHGWVIDSLSFKSVDKNGKAKYSNRYGGEGGDTSDLIQIDWPREYLTSISGTHHTFTKQHVIESLCFQTNKKKHGPFGRTQGSPFDIHLKDRAIVGFHGRANTYIDAIGVYQKDPSS
ncbi:hypothetical protein Q3G72_028780 [Acer saccharum]|nr:hypothetical protein Q3G72_028780 [Acer saccharum]